MLEGEKDFTFSLIIFFPVRDRICSPREGERQEMEAG